MSTEQEMTPEQSTALRDLEIEYGVASLRVDKHANCHPDVTLVDGEGDQWTISPNGDSSLLSIVPPRLPDQDRADGIQRGLDAMLDAGRRWNS